MKLKICDMELKTNKVAENIFLDLLEISIEFGEEEENQLFQWVRPLHLDDEDGNPNPQISAHVREASINVERVLSEKVHSESFSQDTRDLFQPYVTSRPSFDSSVEHSSDQVLLVLLLQVMMAQEEMGLMMIVILEMILRILQIHHKVNIH